MRLPADALGERLPLAVLHDDERDAIRGLVDVIDGGHVLMPHGRG